MRLLGSVNDFAADRLGNILYRSLPEQLDFLRRITQRHICQITL